MRVHTRKWLVTVLVVGLLASVAGIGGCAPKAQEPEAPAANEPVKGGTMSFYIGEPAYIDPYNCQETEGMQVTQALFDSLTVYENVAYPIREHMDWSDVYATIDRLGKGQCRHGVSHDEIRQAWRRYRSRKLVFSTTASCRAEAEDLIASLE